MKNQQVDPNILTLVDRMRVQFLSQADELWRQWEEAIVSAATDGETPGIVVAFAADMDFGQPAQLETRIRFSVATTDKRTAQFDDPSQLGLPLDTTEAAGEPQDGQEGTGSDADGESTPDADKPAKKRRSRKAQVITGEVEAA